MIKDYILNNIINFYFIMDKEFLGYAILNDNYDCYHIYKCYKYYNTISNKKVILYYKAIPLVSHVEEVKYNSLNFCSCFTKNNTIDVVAKLEKKEDKDKEICATCISSLYAED